jgi:hypothetical protein
MITPVFVPEFWRPAKNGNDRFPESVLSPPNPPPRRPEWTRPDHPRAGFRLARGPILPLDYLVGAQQD